LLPGKRGPRAERPAEVAYDTGLQSFTLESLNSAVNYHAWIRDMVTPYLGDHPIEIGPGLGDYAADWLARGLPRITLSEIDPSRRALLDKRFGGDPRVSVRDIDVLAPVDANHSALVAINVLEHIEDHVGALRSAHRLVRPGGAVVMFVPAFPFAMSRFDRAVGHVRRYRLRTLREAYAAAGLRLERIHHVNAPGLPAWFVGMRLLKMTPQDGATVQLWDRYVIPAARKLEEKRNPPFGQSIFAVGRVAGSAA
jgi:SAM-dependent methyltransferase